MRDKFSDTSLMSTGPNFNALIGTLRTTDQERATAANIAHRKLMSIAASKATTPQITSQKENMERLVTILTPEIRHEVPRDVLDTLEYNLHNLMKRIAGIPVSLTL